MNKIIKVFNSEEFGSVRTITHNGDVWFSAIDVCRILDISNPSQALTRLDADEKFTTIISNEGAITGESSMSFVSESGLYSLVLGSRKPNAREFKRWITHDIIPTIRKTGGYVANEDLFINTYLPNVDDNVKALFKLNLQAINQLNQIVDNQRATITSQQKKIEEDKPKVEFADHVADVSDCIDIGTLSKIAKKENIPIERNRLFKWLRKKDFLMSKGKHKNEPYQRYIDNGWFIVREYIYNTAYGEQIGTKTYVTGKGQMCIIERLRKAYENNEIV